MPRRKISFDVAVNTPSAQREADRLANIFQSRLRNVQVGTKPGAGGGSGGGGGGSGSGGPGSDLNNLFFKSAQYAAAGVIYKFYSDLPKNIAAMDELATTNRRAAASFATLAGGTEKANAMIDAYIEGAGGAVDRVTAMTAGMKLFTIGLVDNAEQMRAFTTLSRGMSQALGRDQDYIQQQFSLALANQSLLRFDQLGLSIERHKELVKETAAAYPEMSKELVFQNAMIAQAIEKYYNLATAQEALATSSEVLGTRLKDVGAIFAELVSQNVMQPFAGELASLFGSNDLTLRTSALQNYSRSSNAWANGGSSGMGGFDVGAMYNAIKTTVVNAVTGPFASMSAEQASTNARTADALVNALKVGQSSRNLGVEPPTEFVDFMKQVEQALLSGAPAADEWAGRLNAMAELMGGGLVAAADEATAALRRTQEAGEIMAAKLESVNDRLIGAAQGAVGRLIKEGMSPTQAIGMVGNQDAIEARSRQIIEEGALRGDKIETEAALQAAEQEISVAADAWIDAARDSESAGKRAATALEQAAKKQEKAIVDAANYIEDTYSDMLKNVPGLFGKSEVNEDDLLMAEKGAAINYADDYLRRVMDVAMNKKDRSDVDMGLVRQALGLGEKTSNEETAIRFGRAWESGSLWQNPENIEKFLNVGAVKDQLHDQEMAAIGQQNLKAFFGLGTDQGKEFLKLFGVEALDPIQDGLISEITTRGPIMGETLANAMFQGFKTAALNMPWVQALVMGIKDGLTREQLEQANSNASSDLAEAEGVGDE